MFEIGAYSRKWLWLKLYQVTLEIPAPEIIVKAFLEKREGQGNFRADQDELADFLLDPKNIISLRLAIVVSQSFKNWGLERRAMQEALKKSGASGKLEVGTS